MKIRAKVSDTILKKADTFFTGSVSGRVIELIQNCRRAGAETVTITETHIDDKQSEITIHDDGHGITDWDKILYLGESQWSPEVGSEHPAGIGLFSLAPRSVTLQSNGKMATIEGDAWYGGSEIEIRDDPEGVKGTRIRFVDDFWGLSPDKLPTFLWNMPAARTVLKKNAAFSTMRIIVNGEELPKGKYLPLGHDIHVVEDIGAMIMVVDKELFKKSPDFELHRGAWHNFPTTSLNFHGHILDLQPASGFRIGLPEERRLPHEGYKRHYMVMVQMTKDSSLKLMLPARTQLVEDEASRRLLRQIQYAVLRNIAEEKEHSLAFSWYALAQEMGIEMKEAQRNVISVGGIDRGGATSPYNNFPSMNAKLYTVNPDIRFVFHDGSNGDVLWSYDKESGGDFDPDPVEDVDLQVISAHSSFDLCQVLSEFKEYSWAKDIGTLDFVVIEPEGFIEDFGILDRRVYVYEEIYVTAETFDGEIERFEIPICFHGDDQCIAITEDELRTNSEALFYYCGGYCDSCDYSEQDQEFQEDLQSVLDQLQGPKEDVRRKLYDAIRDTIGAPATITVLQGGTVIIEKDGETTEIDASGDYKIERKNEAVQ